MAAYIAANSAMLAASAALHGLFFLHRKQRDASTTQSTTTTTSSTSPSPEEQPSGILHRYLNGHELDPTAPYDDRPDLTPSGIGEHPPLILTGAFLPETLLGCPGPHWSTMLRTFAHTLPLQMHMEPHTLVGVRSNKTNAPPLFRRTVRTLDTFPQLGDLLRPGDTDPARRGRIKFRVSGGGKFIHRNRYERRNVILCVDGTQLWLLLDTSVGAVRCGDGTLENGAVDSYLDAQQNKNWNGYRSHRHDSMLSLGEMREIARGAPPGVTAVIIRVTAGDVFSFDGRWWHGTSYDRPVVSLFFTPGDNMEVALEQHEKRMALPMQKGLKVATISMAKCSRLSASWKEDKDGGCHMESWEPGMDKKT